MTQTTQSGEQVTVTSESEHVLEISKGESTANDRLIIDDNFDIDDNGHGSGPRLGCVGCQEDVRTQVSASPSLYRRYGVSGPIYTLDCPSCLEELTEAFSL